VVNAAALPGPWLAPVLAAETPARFRAGDRIAAARLPAGSVEADADATVGVDGAARRVALTGSPLRSLISSQTKRGWAEGNWDDREHTFAGEAIQSR